MVLANMILGGLALYYFTSYRRDHLHGSAMLCGVHAVPGARLILWTLPMILLPTHLFGAGSGFINTAAQIGGFLSGILIGWYISLRGGDFSAGSM